MPVVRKGSQTADKGEHHTDEEDMPFLEFERFKSTGENQSKSREMKDILDDKGINCFFRKFTFDKSIYQGVYPVSKEIQNESRNVKEYTSFNKV